MNPRERVNITLNYKKSDKVPIDLRGNQSSSKLLCFEHSQYNC